MRLVCPRCWNDIEEVVNTASGKVRCPSCHAIVEPEAGAEAEDGEIVVVDAGDETPPQPEAAAAAPDKKKTLRKRRYYIVRPSSLFVLVCLAYLVIALLLVLVLFALEQTAGLIGLGLLTLGIILLYVGYALPRWRFERLQPVEGKSRDDILRILGAPNGYNDLGDGHFLLEWITPGCHIALLFHKSRCIEVRQIYFA